ncbi:MAG TPA: O-antigen ligase family protein [Candidatus Ratteibacteria bacterium]|nr:O-antigen ligase family protein [bacterium]HRR95267.1 O-antigen ligase family protein [Candidatus Ratteibacteria bacterium]
MKTKKLEKTNFKNRNFINLESISLIIFFFAGILLNFKPAYDYTIIKVVFGYLFVLLLSTSYILEKKEFHFNYSILIIFLIFFSYILFSSFTAPFKYGSAFLLENYLLYFLIFVLSLNLEIKNEWIYYWLIAAFISSITGLFQYLGPRHYAISTFGNPNFFAGHIIMPICIGISLLFSKEFKKPQKFLTLFFVIICFITLILTRSRAAIVGFLFGISTIFFLINKNKKIKWLGYIILLLISVFLSKFIYKEFLTNIRYYIWTGTIKLIKQKPITGWGFGQFIFYYFYFRRRDYFLQSESTPVTNHAHNEYLEMLSEIGIIGILIFFIFIYIIVNKFFKSKELCGKNYKLEKNLIAGFVGGIFAVMVDNILSTNLRNPSTAMYFYFLLGILGSLRRNRAFHFNISKLLYSTTFFVSFLMIILTSYYRILPDVYLKRGIWAKDMGDYKKAIENYKVVCSLNPYNYTALYKLAFVYGEIGDYKNAERIYLYINNYVFPHFAKTDTNLGTVYLKIGDYEKALKYYLYAEWLNPYDKDVLCSISSIYLIYYNDVDKALKYLNKVLTIDPENRYANTVKSQLKKEGKIK